MEVELLDDDRSPRDFNTNLVMVNFIGNFRWKFNNQMRTSDKRLHYKTRKWQYMDDYEISLWWHGKQKKEIDKLIIYLNLLFK